MQGSVGLVATLIAGTVFLSASYAQQPEAASCGGARGETATIAGVEARLELRLADGRMLRLVGVDPAEGTPTAPDLSDVGRAQTAALLVGKPIAFTLVGAKPDRWGRFPALVDLGSGGSVAEAVLAAGLGRVLAETPAHACRDRLLAAEEQARAAKRGLWSDPYYAVLGTNDRPGYAERSATLAVMQGRLTEIAAGPYRTELRFAAPERTGHDPLIVSIPPRAAKTFRDRGVDFSSLIGRTLRVRGILDLRFGPRLDISDPDALEVLPAAAGPG